jgi:hypothetical protein
MRFSNFTRSRYSKAEQAQSIDIDENEHRYPESRQLLKQN